MRGHRWQPQAPGVQAAQEKHSVPGRALGRTCSHSFNWCVCVMGTLISFKMHLAHFVAISHTSYNEKPSDLYMKTKTKHHNCT